MCPSPQRRLAGLRRERVEARQVSTPTFHLDPGPPTLATAHQMSTPHQTLLVETDRRPIGRPRGSSNVGPHRPGDVQLALSRSLSTSGAPRGQQFVLPFAPPRLMNQVLTSPLFWSTRASSSTQSLRPPFFRHPSSSSTSSSSSSTFSCSTRPFLVLPPKGGIDTPIPPSLVTSPFWESPTSPFKRRSRVASPAEEVSGQGVVGWKDKRSLIGSPLGRREDRGSGSYFGSRPASSSALPACSPSLILNDYAKLEERIEFDFQAARHRPPSLSLCPPRRSKVEERQVLLPSPVFVRRSDGEVVLESGR